MTHAFKPSILGTEAGGSWGREYSRLQSQKLYQTNDNRTAKDDKYRQRYEKGTFAHCWNCTIFLKAKYKIF